MAPADRDNRLSFPTQKSHFCPSPECRVGVEGSQLRQACECCPPSPPTQQSQHGQGQTEGPALSSLWASTHEVSV